MNRTNLSLTAKITASDTQDLYDVAKSKGINLPHPALSIFKSVLAEISKPNANGIRLGEKATEAAVSTLIGCQINKNHLRTGFVMGHIIDAQINTDKDIEITCVFFKDLYEDEWVEAQELFAKNKLTMSFELSADVESQTKLSDGTKVLNDYYFTGSGLLFGVKPACKKARVFEMATKKLQEKLSMERQSLIFANNQNSQKSIMEVLNLMADEVKKIEETVIAEIPKVEEVAKVEVPVETPKTEEELAALPPEVTKMMKEMMKDGMPQDEAMKKAWEQYKKDNKKASEEVTVEETVVAEAPKVEEVAKVEEPVVAQPAVEKVVVVTEVTQKVTDTMEPGKETIVVETETTRSVNDKVQEERKEVTEVTYTYAQMEEVKAGYEKEITTLKEQISAKDKEVEAIKADLEVVKKQKLEAAKEEPVVLATGHKKIDASEESGSPIGKLLKNRRANRK